VLKLNLNTQLHELDLEDNHGGDDGTAALAESLVINTTLVTLNLASNVRIGERGAEALAKALVINTSLTILAMENTSIGDNGTDALAEALKRKTTMKTLGLSFHGNGATAILKTLAECNTTLLNLYWHNIDDDDDGEDNDGDDGEDDNDDDGEDDDYDGEESGTLSAINDIVAANRVGVRLLHAGAELDLSSNGIDARLAATVSEDLAGNAVETKLLLRKNDIGDRGSAEIATALVMNRTLQSIGLEENGIGDAGCSALARALTENSVLSELFLNGNNIGQVGATALAEALHIGTALQQLRLGCNSITDDGALAIADTLKSNTRLKRLDLDGNRISNRAAMMLLKTLKESNITLVQLNLGDNADITEPLLDDIKGVLGSRWVLSSFLKHMLKPLQKGAIPLAVQVVHRSMYSGGEGMPTLRGKAAGCAGFVFHLVQAASSNKSKVIEEAGPSRKWSGIDS
jgi:NLR family CARD domain-containing protein 3